MVGTSSNKIITLIRALRMYQWTKNLLLFAALIFARELGNRELLTLACMAFAAFCLAASATYLFNDLRDIENDRAHPKKKNRPLASGALKVGEAWVLIVLLAAGAIGIGYAVSIPFLLTLLIYMAMTLSYTLALKNLIIIDVMVVALGFVIRAMAGAVAIDIEFSQWLVVCTLFLALFLALGKRRHEITLLEDGASEHREVLFHYSVQYLDQLILIVAGGAIITYTIYTCSQDVIDKLGTDNLYLTLPFVVYGIFRYLYLVHHKTGGGDPSSTLIKDFPMALTVGLWGTACVAIIYWEKFVG